MKYLALIILSSVLGAGMHGATASKDLNTEGQKVEIGMGIFEAKELLAQKGIEVSSRYQLSIMPGDTETELEFCNLDKNITLVFSVDKESEIIRSLGIYFIPDNRTSKIQVVVREASSIRILNDGQIELTLIARKSDSE